MEHIIEFLENPKKSRLYKVLNLKDEELEILKFMLNAYINSEENILVRDLLGLFEKEPIKSLKYIDYIKNLLNEGWIVLGSFTKLKSNDLTILELFNSDVSLSVSFLKLLEKGEIDLVIPKATPYKDHLEFLQDQFLRVEIYEQLLALKQNSSFANLKRLQSKLNVIESTIKERIKKTKIDLEVLNIIEEYDLDEKEEIIFLALLKEEYTGSNENVRELNYLLDLVSVDEVDRIKNRTLLDDNSKLIKEGILEYDELFGAFGGYTKLFFITEDILNNLMHPRKHKIEHIVKESMFELIKPEVSLKDVVLPKTTKSMINTILKQVDKRVLKLLKEWGIKNSSDIEAKIIFYGYPGTGKTMSAYAIANELKKPLLSLDSSKILSMYVGESEKNVRRIFDEYYEIADKLKTKPILLFNEADQFLSTRTTSSLSSADKMHNQMQNIFLEQVEKFDGILIATTNLLETIDTAFSRRFEYKVEFKKPTFKERKKIWELKLPKNATFEDEFDVNKLAKYDLTGAQIEVIVKKTALNVALRKEPIFKTEDFIIEIEKEKRSAFDYEKEVGF